jgi:hypothetical protein
MGRGSLWPRIKLIKTYLIPRPDTLKKTPRLYQGGSPASVLLKAIDRGPVDSLSSFPCRPRSVTDIKFALSGKTMISLMMAMMAYLLPQK